jgi:23S rRNA pseudouridine1911/1915/1917 synthase
VPEQSVVTVLRVPPESAGQRVDVFVQSQLRRTSRTRAHGISKASAYDPVGRRLRPGSRVRAEQHILLWRAPWDETPVPTDVPVLWEDEHMLVVDKPANLPVHPTARYYRNTLIKVLQAERPDQWLSLGHRLDRETSGVLVLSKTSACDRALKRMLEAREGIEKTYEAITWGVPRPLPEDRDVTHNDGERFRVDLPLELDPDAPSRVKMRTSPTGVEAGTRFIVLGVSPSGRYARVRCELETGRQHQIRVHLAALGTPVVGDKLYGPDEELFAKNADHVMESEDWERLELPRHALHAARLELPHPITGSPLVFVAPLPADLALFWELRAT